MNGVEPKVGQRIRWTYTEVVEGTVESIVGQQIRVREDAGRIRVYLLDAAPEFGTIVFEILADPEPTITGSVVRDGAGDLWALREHEIDSGDRWVALNTHGTYYNTWGGLVRPVAVVSTPGGESRR